MMLIVMMMVVMIAMPILTVLRKNFFHFEGEQKKSY